MMLLRGGGSNSGGNRRLVYGRGAWRNTILLLAVLAVLAVGFFKQTPAEKHRTAHPAAVGEPTQAIDPRTTELGRLKMLGHALRLHADEHEGRFPDSIGDIHWRQSLPGMQWEGLPAAVSRFHHPGNGQTMDWLYYAGRTEHDAGETILVASPVALGEHGDQRMVARVNSVAEVIPEADFQRQVAAQRVPGEGATVAGPAAAR